MTVSPCDPASFRRVDALKRDGAASTPALPANLGIERTTLAGHTVSAFAGRAAFCSATDYLITERWLSRI